ncbi:MAG: zinc metalloprotease HtpX [Methanosphaera sp.]|nr:zinc metalloprotease HtpX [Methanosphaera sp.]
MLENLKTVILLGFLSAILVIIFGFLGRVFNLGSLGILIGLFFAIVMNFVSYFYSDKIALRSYNAKIVSEEEAPNLHRIVTDLANRANIKKPRVAVIQSSDPNAFATGRNQNHAVVAVTTGILQLLNEDELRGVISHEMGHIKNRDILISSVAATVAGMIVALASWSRFAVIFASRDNDGLMDIVSTILIAILGPIAASIIQLAISRSREYKADATGAQICGNPLALANALRKLEFGVNQHPMNNAKSTDAHMFIINPFGNAGSKIKNLFSTHPETSERIRRLEEMASTQSFN